MSAIKKTVTAVIIAIGVVILMTAMAALITPFNNAGLANSQLCTSVGCSWNASRTVDCTTTNTTPADTTECAEAGYEQPLGSFFESTGVMPLVFGAVTVILAILFLIVMFRKK